MAITVMRNDELSRFEIYIEGQLAGFADFKVNGKVMAFSYTQIDSKFGTRGLGGQLIQFALDQAIVESLEVAPYCTFVSAYIRKNSDKYIDLVPNSSRTKFNL